MILGSEIQRLMRIQIDLLFLEAYLSSTIYAEQVGLRALTGCPLNVVLKLSCKRGVV